MSDHHKTREELLHELQKLRTLVPSLDSRNSRAMDSPNHQTTQEALRESETRLASIIDTAMDAIITVDETQTIVLFNRAAERIFKCLSSEAAGQPVDRFIPARFREVHREHIQQFGKTTETSRSMGKLGTLLAVRANGEEFPIEASISQTVVKGKSLFTVILRDITEQNESERHRARTERILRENEERYRIVMEHTGKLVYDFDVATGAIQWSGAVNQVTGYSIEEFRTVDIKRWEMMIHPDDREEALGLLTKAMSSAEVYDFQYRFQRKDGSYIYVHDTGTFVTNDQGKAYRMLGTMGDVTEKVNAEQALRESEERYRQFFEDDLTGDFISKSDGQLVSCNPAFVRIFGFDSVEDALRTNTADLYPNGETRQAYIELVRQKKRLESYEVELRRRDGKPVYVVETVIGSFDVSGELVELKGYVFDISERKKLEEQLLQSQKMEAVGQLASGIAHDFNNVMGVVLTASNLLNMKSSDPDITRYAKMIEEATLRGAAIAKQLLQFSRAEAAKLAPVSVSQTVLEAKKFLEHSFPKTIVIDVRIGPQQGLVMADAGQIHQMILNLCINARDAILERKDRPRGGRIVIALEPASGQFIEEKYGWKSSEQYVLLSISDDGKGIPDEIRRRIFDPFFTTKGIGKGTGLGLSIVHGIVKAHNAIIDVESKEGVGTTFLVYLPAISHHVIMDVPQEGAHIGGSGETILIIEDEPLLRDLLKEFLLRAGYNVVEAVDGEEGIEKYREHAATIDLVLSDIGLPKLGGEQTFKAIRSINPRAKVVFCTGFIEEDSKGILRKAGALDILHKPYKVSEVLHTVREALDTP